MRNTTLRRLTLTLALAATAACGDADDKVADDAPDAAPPDAAVEKCPTPSGPGTLHLGRVVADETWAAADGPHRVVGPVQIAEGATVTIERCAEVRLAPEAGVEVGLPDGLEVGHLVVAGEEDAAVRFVRDGAAAWGALVVHAPSSLHLTHAELIGGGGDIFLEGATVVGLGGAVTPAAPVLHVDHVSVRDSVGPGVVLGRAARFSDDSTDLEVRDAGTWPMLLGLHALDSVPPGAYGDNGREGIVLRDDNANDRQGLQEDATLRDRGVPYVAGYAEGDRLYVGANGPGGQATLTIEAGVEVRFVRGGGLRVVADAHQPRGRLRVEGTPLDPVVFTSAGSPKEKGAWSGLYFEGPMRDNRVDHARIEWAGGSCGCQLTSCSPLDTFDAAIVIDGRPGEVFVQNTTIAHSAGHGVVRSWLDAKDLDFAADNTFDDIEGCNQTAPEVSDTACPDPSYACQQ